MFVPPRQDLEETGLNQLAHCTASQTTMNTASVFLGATGNEIGKRFHVEIQGGQLTPCPFLGAPMPTHLI